MSVASARERRYCARGQECVAYHVLGGNPTPLGKRNPDDICEACRKAGHVAGEDRARRSRKGLERRYDGLLRAGTALLEEGKATESEVVGSLVFAALAPVVPELERIQCLFAAATGAEWDGLALRFYNTFEPLEAKRVVDGLLVVGRASNRVEVVYEPETGLVDSIVLEVDDLSVTAGKVATSSSTLRGSSTTRNSRATWPTSRTRLRTSRCWSPPSRSTWRPRTSERS